MPQQDTTFIERPTFKGGTEVHVIRTQTVTQCAGFAITLLEKWGLVAALPDGEDSAGRQKLALHAPKELVERACQIAECAFAEFAKRDWLIDLPIPKIEMSPWEHAQAMRK